jgi:hypothetical protein
MLFTLEALQAKHGDSLILHYGKPKSPKMIVIDGGPAGVYKDSLRPRLDELKASRSPDAPLSIRMLMVSHLDDDHINGVVSLLRNLAGKGKNEQLEFDIVTLWHNSFDDIIGNKNDADELVASFKNTKPVAGGGALAAGLPVSLAGGAIAASVPQGREVREHAKTLGLSVNSPFERLVQAPVKGKKTVTIGDGLKFTVIGPLEDRIEELQIEWNAVIKAKGLAKNEKGRSLAAAYLDESVFNLSSICVLAEAGGKKMLLTGDARGDHTLIGLTGAGLLKKGTLHVDLLKMPHHGSDRNVETDFFRQITADHYVISADGKHGNPEISTLQMISEARGKAKYTVYLTNREPRLTKFFASEKKRGKKYDVVFRDNKELSLWVDLGDDALAD